MAYGAWGFFPVYFHAIAQVAPLEVLGYRAVCSLATLAVILAAARQWAELFRTFRSRRAMVMLGASSLLIAANWLVFIYAVGSGQVLQSSLGYYINPLVNVLLGVVILRERLRTRQRWSLVLAGCGVIVLTAMVGRVPWIALTLAVTFALYGYLRKTMPVSSLIGLTVETLLLAPPALAYLGFLSHTQQATANGRLFGLLLLSGVVTSIPLLLFAAGARRLRLSTLGFVQYVTPTLHFLLAVVVYGEPFSLAQILSFVLIWSAVGLYAYDSLRSARLRTAITEPGQALEP